MPASRFAKWAGTRIESRVTEVTRVTDTPNPSISAALVVAAKVTRAAEPKVTRVTAPSPSAIEVTQVTQHPTPGFPRKLIDNQCSNPGNPSNPQNEKCPTSPSFAGDPAWWRDFFEERAAIRKIDCRCPREDAEGFAFDEVIHEWHHLHGARPNCVIGYGQKWRGAAVAALRALGLDPPKGFTLL